MQGVSLKPLLTQSKTDNWREAVYYRYYAAPAHTGIRTQTHLMSWVNNKVDLYDLEKDPSQMNNLAQDERYTKIQKSLTQKHRNLSEEILYSEKCKRPYS